MTREYDVKIHWRDGTTSTGSGSGNSPAQAVADYCRRAGIGAGAIAAMDYWEAWEAAFADAERREKGNQHG